MIRDSILQLNDTENMMKNRTFIGNISIILFITQSIKYIGEQIRKSRNI